MSETSIIAIILSLVAVGGTLGGTWLGRLLERSDEKRKWKRERCVKQNEVVIEAVSEMDRSLHKAILLLSGNVYNKVFDLVNHCGKEIGTKSQMCPKLPIREWSKIRITDFATLYMDCILAARNDLELFTKQYRVIGFKESKEELSKLEEELSNGTISPEEVTLRLQEIKMKLKMTKKEWYEKDIQAKKNK